MNEDALNTLIDWLAVVSFGFCALLFEYKYIRECGDACTMYATNNGC